MSLDFGAFHITNTDHCFEMNSQELEDIRRQEGYGVNKNILNILKQICREARNSGRKAIIHTIGNKAFYTWGWIQLYEKLHGLGAYLELDDDAYKGPTSGEMHAITHDMLKYNSYKIRNGANFNEASILYEFLNKMNAEKYCDMEIRNNKVLTRRDNTICYLKIEDTVKVYQAECEYEKEQLVEDSFRIYYIPINLKNPVNTQLVTTETDNTNNAEWQQAVVDKNNVIYKPVNRSKSAINDTGPHHVLMLPTSLEHVIQTLKLQSLNNLTTEAVPLTEYAALYYTRPIFATEISCVNQAIWKYNRVHYNLCALVTKNVIRVFTSEAKYETIELEDSYKNQIVDNDLPCFFPSIWCLDKTKLELILTQWEETQQDDYGYERKDIESIKLEHNTYIITLQDETKITVPKLLHFNIIHAKPQKSGFNFNIQAPPQFNFNQVA